MLRKTQKEMRNKSINPSEKDTLHLSSLYHFPLLFSKSYCQNLTMDNFTILDRSKNNKMKCLKPSTDKIKCVETEKNMIVAVVLNVPESMLNIR